MCAFMLSYFNRVRLFAIPRTVAHQALLSLRFSRKEYWSGTVAHQALLSLRFSRQKYWSGLPCPPPGYHPNPGIKLAFLMSPALAGEFFITSTTWEAPTKCIYLHNPNRYPGWQLNIFIQHPRTPKGSRGKDEEKTRWRASLVAQW